MKRRAGFSLAEVAVAAAIVGVVTFYMSELLVRQSRTYTVVDSVSEAQQNLRAIARLLESELRNTGYVVQMGAALCGYDTTTAGNDTDPDVLFVTDASAMAAPLAEDASGTTLYPNAPKTVTGNPGAGVTAGVSAIVSTNGMTASAAAVVLSDVVVDGYAYYDVDGDGVKDSDFQYNAATGRTGGVILFENNAPSKGAACGLIEGVDVASKTLTVDFTVNGAQPSGSGLAVSANLLSVRALPAHVYWIQNDANGVPGLMRDGMLLSPDVEDLQFAAFYDLDDDGTVDGASETSPPFNSATEYPGSSAATSQFLSSAIDNSLLREIRATIVLRTRSQDPNVLVNSAQASQMPQSFENRAPWGGAADGFRRRALTVTVQPRNVARRANFGS